jgi:multiple sugar transport system permease protein
VQQLSQASDKALTTAGIVRPRTSRVRRWQRRYIGVVFIAPWAIAFLLFELLPTASAFYYIFTNFAVVGETQVIGLANYQQMATQDPEFWTAVFNTLYYTAFTVPISLVLGFGMALLLNAPLRGQGLFRTLFYVPAVVPTVAASIVWLWIFDPSSGLLDNLLRTVGLPAVHWLSSPGSSKNALILMNLWAVGGTTVVFLAGLQALPGELYEAAAIDGAGKLRTLVQITLPLMTPSIFFNLVLGVIGSFQVFNAAFIVTQGGPADSTLFYMLYLYNEAFKYLQMGYASAMAVVLFLVIMILTLVLYRSSSRWVFYG